MKASSSLLALLMTDVGGDLGLWMLAAVLILGIGVGLASLVWSVLILPLILFFWDGERGESKPKDGKDSTHE